MVSNGPYKSFQLTPATPTIGANVTGIDLSRPVSPEQVADIRRALLAHQVLFFRGQSRIEPEVQLELGRQFGKRHLHPAPRPPSSPGRIYSAAAPTVDDAVEGGPGARKPETGKWIPVASTTASPTRSAAGSTARAT